MRLDHDCVRGVLLAIESDLALNDRAIYSRLSTSEHLQGLSSDHAYYAFQVLWKGGYIDGVSGYRNSVSIHGLTWEGHQLLDNLRDETVWSKVKAKTSFLSSVSVDILAATASGVITDLIKGS